MFRHRLPLLLGLFILLLLGLRLSYELAFDRFQAHRRTVTPWTEIYQGVSYLSRRLPDDPEGRGMMYLIRVDLNVPGTDVWLRPSAPDQAQSLDGFYDLQYPWQFAKREHLAVTINGTYFSAVQRLNSVPRMLRSMLFYGADARQAGPIVIDHHVAGDKGHGVFIWLDDDLTPHMRIHSWRQNLKDLEIGKFAVTNWYPVVQDGRIGAGAESAKTCQLHARTVFGIDTDKRLLYLACFERASYLLVARELVREGVPDAITFDGGGSSCLTLGDQARHIRPGTVLGGLRPVGSVLGIRANPLP
ncbi:MAG: phosphodiester glycosidase family protein [Phycisphaerales bacterium]